MNRTKDIVKNIKYKYFDNTSILIKLGLCFGIVIIFIFGLSFANFYNYREDKEKTITSVVEQMNLQTSTDIDNYVQDLYNLTKTPLFYEINEAEALKYLEQSNSGEKAFWEVKPSLENIFENIFSLKSNLHSVFIYNLKGENTYKVAGSYNFTPIDVTKQGWFYRSINNFGSPILIPTYYITDNPKEYSKSNLVFGVVRGLVRISNSKVEGTIVINTGINELSKLVKKSLVYKGQRIIISDNQGHTIYDTIESNITKSLDSDLKNKVSVEGYSNHVEIDKVDYLLFNKYSSVTDWTITNMIPVNSLNEGINKMLWSTSLITLIFLLLVLGILIVLFNQIGTPIKSLTKVMRVVESGDFNIRVKVQRDDELGALSKTFNKMTEKINILINEVYIDKLKQKDLEMQMLQNQINPHFIYNTLEAIHMSAEFNNDKEVSSMSVALGSLLRYGLSRKDNTVTVKDEIACAASYVMLQQMRLDNIAEYIVDMDEDLYDYQIIKLLLQPVIENSIYHGLSSREYDGVIKLKGYLEGENLIFDIVDNGAGIPPETLSDLTAYINGLNEKFTSIGLKNVNMRIKLHYGNNYGLQLLSRYGSGTTVRIKLPALKGGI